MDFYLSRERSPSFCSRREVREFIQARLSVRFARARPPSLSPPQAHGVLDLYPRALAHPRGMPRIFKQVLHFEISSRRDISRASKYTPAPGSCSRRSVNTSPRRIRLHSASREGPAQLSARLHPSPFDPALGPSPLGSPPPRSAEPLHASHISPGLEARQMPRRREPDLPRILVERSFDFAHLETNDRRALL